MDKKEAEEEALRKAKDTQHAAGKNVGMSGRDLVRFSHSWHCEHNFTIHLVPIQPRMVRRRGRGRRAAVALVRPPVVRPARRAWRVCGRHTGRGPARVWEGDVAAMTCARSRSSAHFCPRVLALYPRRRARMSCLVCVDAAPAIC